MRQSRAEVRTTEGDAAAYDADDGGGDAAALPADARRAGRVFDVLPANATKQQVGHDQRGYRLRRFLAVSDCAAIVCAIALTTALELVPPFRTASTDTLLLGIVAVALWLPLAGISGMFHVDETRLETSVADELGRVLQLAAVWILLLALPETLIVPGSERPVAPPVALWVVSVPAILVFRSVVRRWAQGRPWYRQAALLVGMPGDTERVAAILQRHPDYGVEIVQRLTLNPADGAGRIALLTDRVRESGADRVIFASTYEGLGGNSQALRLLSDQGVKIDFVPGEADASKVNAELHFIEGVPILTLLSSRRPRSTSAVKRAMDVTAASAGLVVLSPYFAYVAVRIKLASPGPVFFRQPRVGRDGKKFDVLKFRTMYADADARKHEVAPLQQRTDGLFKIADDPRVTGYGAKLRRSSLDELPQLINVLRGEMSLVGPRPLIEAESDLVSAHYRARFDVRPGLTGPWQVLGRSDIPFEDMLKLDYAYVTNWSVPEDLRLLVRTVGATAQGRGAY